MSYRPGKEVIRQALEKCDVGQISELLDVDPAHIYNLERRGVSPRLHEALVDAGWIDPPPKVYTLAFRFRSRADFERARRAVDADGDRTEWIMRQVEAQ